MTSMKRRMAEWVADKLDLHVIPKPHSYAWPEEQFMQRLLARLQPDCIFDVGANVGQYGSLLRKLGYTGTIISFEPAPAALDALTKASADDPNWHVKPFALGAEKGSLPFNIMEKDVFSSFLQPTPSPDFLQDFLEDNVVSKTIEVDVTTLDDCYASLAREYGFSKPFLKMDTQGFDLHVIRGAAAKISNFLGLLSEVSIRRLYDDAPSFYESIPAFNDAGFELVGLYTVHPGTLLRLIEFNCYCVRRDIVESE